MLGRITTFAPAEIAATRFIEPEFSSFLPGAASKVGLGLVACENASRFGKVEIESEANSGMRMRAWIRARLQSDRSGLISTCSAPRISHSSFWETFSG